jgi:ubiquinone/menaquinone biosynthesis C-methylase UbiE
MPVNYDLITEVGGTPITEEAASMVFTRYAVAAELARGRRTLEIGCASGVGLGLMNASAELVIGGDVFLPMLRTAREHYGERIPLVQFSATDLPFNSNSFDLVVFMEATYYVRDFDRALTEIDRILDPAGVVMFVNANPERPDFIRSPHSEHYHSAHEFRQLLETRGYIVQTSGAFSIVPSSQPSLPGRFVSRVLPVARRIAEVFHLVPRTLRGRARIKRFLFGKLRSMPRELPQNFAVRADLTAVNHGPVCNYKVIYVIGSPKSTDASGSQFAPLVRRS